MEQRQPKKRPESEAEPKPVCAACSGTDGVVPVDESGDTYFCAECRAMILSYREDKDDPFVDVGTGD